MARWAVRLGLLGWCVLYSAGCRKAEGAACDTSTPTAACEPSEAPSVQPALAVQPLKPEPKPEPKAPAPEAARPEPAEPPATPEPPAEASEANEEQPPSRLLETDSAAWEREPARSLAKDDDKAWFREAAAAASAVDTSGASGRPLEQVTIATSSVDGRVKRVRPGTIEVSDNEGNVYELRIDGRSRALRRGRHISLKAISEGMPVRASFDLVGGGESLARDIELRR